jgi:hypothetical protein
MDNLPPGFKPISGKRNAPKHEGGYYVMLRCGYVSPVPWPVHTTRWVWDGIAPEGDVIAVKAAGQVASKDGRQANGSYE